MNVELEDAISVIVCAVVSAQSESIPHQGHCPLVAGQENQ
jgi:hypothetical protein